MITQCFNNPTRSLFLVVFFKDYSIFSLFFFKSTCSEYYPIIKMNNIFNLFYTFYEYVLYTAHYFWLSEKHRKVFNKLYPFLLLYMKSGDNISNQSAQSFFCMVSFFFFFLQPNIIYTCLYIYLHVYIIKFTKVNITSMASRLKLHTDTCLTPGTGVQTMSHFRRVSNIQHESNLQRRGAHGVIEINFCSFLF